MSYTTNNQQSEFNMSFGFLTRLGMEFFWLADSKARKDLDQWIEALAIIYTELYNYYKKEAKRDEDYQELQQIKDSITPFLSSRNKNIPRDLYWRMITFELNLRRVMKDNNMELKMSQDPRLAI